MASDILLITIVGAVVGLMTLAVKFCYKSKCVSIKLCWGMVAIQRDVQGEEHLDEIAPPPSPTTPSPSLDRRAVL